MNDIHRIFVLGATGDQGLPLLDRLLADGFEVTAGVRRPDAFKDSRFGRLPTRPASLDDEESLARAFDGHDALAMHLPFEFDRERASDFGARVAAAARRAGLRKIVFNTSCYVADRDLGLSAHDGRRDIERHIAETGIPHVIIRPMVFMDNVIRVWAKPSIVKNGIFAYPAGEDLKISWICLEDVAAYMALALRTDALVDLRLRVGGPEALTGAEVAERLSQAAGRPIRFQSLSPDAYAEKMSFLVTGSSEVAPHSIYDGMASFYRWYNAQPTSPLALDPAEAHGVLPIRSTPLLDWARRQDWSRP